jgi:magnesium transporter
MKYISETQQNGLLWVNVARQDKKEVAEVAKRFGFLKSDAEECLPPFQRPKIVKREGYYFIILHFPVFDRLTKRLNFTELDVFLNSSYIVTIHDGSLLPIEGFFEEVKKNEKIRQTFFGGTAAHVLFELMNRLQEAIFPILLHINEDITAVDSRLLAPQGGERMTQEILRLKTNIVTFRRTMQGHRTVFERLVLYGGKDLNLSMYQSYLNNVREANGEIWHMLESQKESIYALHEAYESSLTIRTNQVMKTLTVISVVTFPLTLLTSVFAIHAKGTPFVENSFGFYIILGMVLFGAGILVTIFKKKEWI